MGLFDCNMCVGNRQSMPADGHRQNSELAAQIASLAVAGGSEWEYAWEPPRGAASSDWALNAQRSQKALDDKCKPLGATNLAVPRHHEEPSSQSKSSSSLASLLVALGIFAMSALAVAVLLNRKQHSEAQGTGSEPFIDMNPTTYGTAAGRNPQSPQLKARSPRGLESGVVPDSGC